MGRYTLQAQNRTYYRDITVAFTRDKDVSRLAGHRNRPDWMRNSPVINHEIYRDILQRKTHTVQVELDLVSITAGMQVQLDFRVHKQPMQLTPAIACPCFDPLFSVALLALLA